MNMAVLNKILFTKTGDRLYLPCGVVVYQPDIDN